MLTPPFRSPREQVDDLYHFGRMLDKIRCHLGETLPEEYLPNLGHPYGLDGHLCGFLETQFSDIVAKTREGLTDEDILEWCYENGHRPNPVQKAIWNGFAEKFGWRDRAALFLEKIKAEDGSTHREDLQTSFDLIDQREGRIP